MSQEWKYVENQFVSSTLNSYKKALRLSQFHDGVLRTRASIASPDADDVLMYNRYHPAHLLYVTKYTAWKNAGGQQEGQTLNLGQLLAQTTAKLDLWDQSIIPVTGVKTPAYKALFPNGRGPFQSGTIDSRLEAFNTLVTALALVPALAAVQALVAAHYALLDDARDDQSGAKSATGTGSIEVNAQRIVVMNLQYADTGLLMNKHFTNPDLIKPYFDLAILRDHTQSVFTGTLDPGEVEPVLIHTFVSDDQLRCRNTGPEPYTLYLAATPGGMTGTPVIIAAGDDVIINITAFNQPNLATARYLTAKNGTTAETFYEIELL